jgi:predicted NUDIX family phosphoesterase
MATVAAEKVLVVPTALLHHVGYFQGFHTNVDDYLAELLRPDNTSYRPRQAMEHDPSYKQLIPYVIFRHGGREETTRLFQYTRGTGQGEERLHSKLSIGIGGHISSTDAVCTDRHPYQEGMRRELEEEVLIETPYEARCVGLINDDQTEVGQVHLGIVYIFDVEQPKVWPRETEILDASFGSLSSLRSRRDEMESWSRICFDVLFSGH